MSGTSCFSDGSSGWLADAQLQYAVSFLVHPPPALPSSAEVSRGRQYDFNNVTYEVSTLTRASYKGVEGELPFPFYGKTEMLFADLRTAGRQFGTLDYSDPTPRCIWANGSSSRIATQEPAPVRGMVLMHHAIPRSR